MSMNKIKKLGISRKIDDLGRISIPVEIRKTLGLEKSGILEFSIDGNKIILEKFDSSCSFCGQASDIEIMGKFICYKCKEKIANYEV